jgi:hypothetical protein
MDKFHEQLLRTEKSFVYKMLQFSMYFAIVLIVLGMGTSLAAGNVSMLIMMVVLAAGAFASKIMRDRQYKEYEYIFTNGNLQIDVIYNKKKRKTLYDIDVKNFEEFGKASEISVSSGVKKVVCIPWNNKDEKYVFLTSANGKQAVYIAPNQDILKYINIYVVKRAKF